jgi:hypothetical protein
MLLELIKKGTLAAAALAAVAASTTAAAWTAPDFPRIGGIQYGSPMNFNDPTYQANLAKQDIMVLANYPTLAPGGMSMQTVVSNIKAKNPNALVFYYVAANELHADTEKVGTAFGPWRAQIDHMKWWLYSDTKQTQFVNAGYGMAYDYALNVTLFTPKDSQGNTGIEWATRWFVSTLATPSPAIDGLFMDNVFWRPYIDGDWNRDGKVDSQTNPTVQSWFRQGYARYYSLVKTLMPGKYQMGNIGDWGDPTSTLTEYTNMVNGGLMEAYIGKSWSIETWGGWAQTLQRYRRVMGSIAAPKLGIFNQWGSRTDYQGMRYGLATCLLDDGYYSFTDTTAQYSGVVWFDELDQKLGAGQTVPAAAWQKGVWRRDFDNGIALVNPKGNGTQTVTLESAFVKIRGTQDPVTNNGQTVTTVTLKDRDGIILLRQKPVIRPATPTGFTIEH